MKKSNVYITLKQLFVAGLSAFFFPVLIADSSLGYSNSIFSVLMMIVCFLLLHCTEKENFTRRLKVCSHILGFLFSIMTAYGYTLGNVGSIDYLDPMLIASILLYAHLFGEALALLWQFISQREEGFFCGGKKIPQTAFGKIGGGKRLFGCLYQRPLLLFILLLMAWLPCYVSTCPGNFMYDASYEYYQLRDGFSRSYPLLHSAIITRLLGLSERLTGSVNLGIAVYTIVQMIAASALFTCILRRFYSDAIHPAMLIILTLYYALFPVVHLLITCTTRDVLFSLLLTWLVYLFYLVASNPEYIFVSYRKTCLLAGVLVFTLLARNNNSGSLMMLIMLAVCVAMFISFGRKYFKQILLFSASAIGLFYMVNAILVSLCQPLYQSPPSSSMSILAQPIVRAYMYHGDTWPEEDRIEFESYFTMETLEYFPQNADPAKGNLTVRYHNMREFLSFWIKIGLRYPACYMDAVLAGTRQMWFPASVLDGYTVREEFPIYEKHYFYLGNYSEEIGSRMNFLPSVFKYYERIGLMISFERIPMISMIFSIGFHVWMLLYCVFYTIYKGRYRLFWPILVLLIYTICSAFVPLVLLRYFAALFLSFPLVMVITLCPALHRGDIESEYARFCVENGSCEVEP